MVNRSDGSGFEGPHDQRLLVIGGSGFIGSEVVRGAVMSNIEVTVLARHRVSDPNRPWLDDAHWIIGSAADSEVLQRALTGATWVVDAVGCPPPAAVDYSHEGLLVQILPTLALLLDTLRHYPGVGLTYLSSGGAIYGNSNGLPVPEEQACAPISPYGATKLIAEQCLRTHSETFGIPIRILRVANAYGPNESTVDGQGLVAKCVDAARSDRRITLFGDGSNVRDYVGVSDVAASVLQLRPTFDEFTTVNVGSGIGFQNREVVALVEKVAGVELTITWSPSRTVDVDAIVLDTSRLSSLLAWEPRPFEDGVEHMWRHRSEHITSHSYESQVPAQSA